MIIKITPSKLSGRIFAPPSKSYSHRLIIAACLSGKSVSVKSVGESNDVIATANCMKELGADCTLTNGNFTVKSFTPVKSALLNANESGSTLRFIIPVCAALGVNAKIVGSEKLLSRPSLPLFDALGKVGAKICADGKSISVSGIIQKNEITIDASISSQYVSGLLLALSAIQGESILKVVGKSVSQNYVNITVDVLKSMGVKVTENEREYAVSGKSFSPKKEYFTEGDYSGAAFMLAAAAIGGEVTVKGLKTPSIQGDTEIVDVIKRFGASVDIKGDEITVKAAKLKGIKLSCEDVPDLAQIISVLAAYSEGETVLTGLGRLKFKESDRLKAITDMLEVARIKFETDVEELIIHGGKPMGGKFFSGNDHRTAMSAAILATFAEGESTIIGAEAVAKSYPKFFDDYTMLGGNADVVI